MRVQILFAVSWVTLAMQSLAAFAGDDFFRNKSVGGYYHYGYVWAHKPRVEHLNTGHTQGGEIFFQTQTDGSKWWQRVHGYPQTGFSVMYFNLANPVAGTATAAIAYVNLSLVRSDKFLFSFQTGVGLGYLFKKFDTGENRKNMAIGSHVNAAIRVHFLTRYRLAKDLFFHLNYGITHFSNGSFRLPNFGLNNISLSGGLSYELNPDPDFKKPEIPALNKKLITEFVYGLGVKENYPPDGKQSFAHTFYVQFVKPLSHRSRVALGADVFYDLSLYRFVGDSVPPGDEYLKVLRSGIHAGYEMPLNKITILIHMGYYLLNEMDFDGSFYHRYGLKYRVSKNFFINLSLKSHWARADYFELGLGWRI